MQTAAQLLYQVYCTRQRRASLPEGLKVYPFPHRVPACYYIASIAACSDSFLRRYASLPPMRILRLLLGSVRSLFVKVKLVLVARAFDLA